MLGKACLLGFGVSLEIAISTLSAAAQDTAVDQATKVPATSAEPAANDTAHVSQSDSEPGSRPDQCGRTIWDTQPRCGAVDKCQG
jgi:hypothetical protein